MFDEDDGQVMDAGLRRFVSVDLPRAWWKAKLERIRPMNCLFWLIEEVIQILWLGWAWWENERVEGEDCTHF